MNDRKPISLKRKFRRFKRKMMDDIVRFLLSPFLITDKYLSSNYRVYIDCNWNAKSYIDYDNLHYMGTGYNKKNDKYNFVTIGTIDEVSGRYSRIGNVKYIFQLWLLHKIVRF